MESDILISGGGIAGLVAAAAFGAAGFRVICVDPAPPVTSAADPGADLRSTAFLQPAQALLDAAGLWARIAPHAAELRVMRLLDAGGTAQKVRLARDFDSAELSGRPFGWNFPNWLLRRETVARLAELETVTFRPGIATTGVTARDSAAIVRLSDGTQVRARLLIAADGRNSPVRKALGIGVRTLRYGQKALAFGVTHPEPHHGVSTEIHRSGGPFTLVPLPDREGSPASAVVWMERGPEAERLAALPPAAFEAEATARACAILGPLRLATGRALWPIVSQMAMRLTAPRTVLVAEAAHVVPPIGAQGLNMSLADIASLLELAEADRTALGSPAMLATHARRRQPDMLARIAGIDALNRAAMVSAQPLRDLRAGALGALHALAPVRRGLMRAGLGLR